MIAAARTTQQPAPRPAPILWFSGAVCIELRMYFHLSRRSDPHLLMYTYHLYISGQTATLDDFRSPRGCAERTLYDLHSLFYRTVPGLDLYYT